MTDKSTRTPTVNSVTQSAQPFSFQQVRPAIFAELQKMGITSPTPIQVSAIPAMLAGHDLLGQAPTGSGKTLAFTIPMIEACDTKVNGVQSLVLVPTRELAIQIADVAEPLAKACKLKLTLLYGGRSLVPEQSALRRGPHIIIGTPGRTLDHLRQGALNLKSVKVFVLDEADEMLDRGFAPDVERIIGYTPTTRQTALFSATMPQWVKLTAEKHMRSPVTVRVTPDKEAPAVIEQIVYEVGADVKLSALKVLLDKRGEGSVLVFGRTKHGVKKLATRLVQLGYPTAALQGNLSQNAREKVMADFRSGKLPILVATNVAARGIDVSDIDLVINYEMPETAELFTHRVGRTGRMGRAGTAITLLTAVDFLKWHEMQKALGRRIAPSPWPHGELARDPLPMPSPQSRQPRQRSSGGRPPRGDSRPQGSSRSPRSGGQRGDRAPGERQQRIELHSQDAGSSAGMSALERAKARHQQRQPGR
ncbi:MAG: DEAD/DEAH box helicase [SAR202 cluster bacterium]|nr:DEAD/DEAH box helicase [SAR202 cluster bacterium]